MLESRSKGPHTDRWMVEDAWDWDEIEQAYETYMLECPDYPKEITVITCRDWVRREKKLWNQAISKDPLLPSALLPNGYSGKQALLHREKMLSQMDHFLETILSPKNPTASKNAKKRLT